MYLSIKYLIPAVLLCFFLPGKAQVPFQEITLSSGIDHYYTSPDAIGGGAAFFDMDNDGDLDYLVVNNNTPFFLNARDKVQLFRNESNNGKNWLGVVLE